MISRELIRRIRRIELRTSRVVDDMIAGRYRSAFKGQGIEFEEVRPYLPGDDVRAIDWKVTARNRVPYVKLFQEERVLTMHLLVDISGSQAFGSTDRTKYDVAVEISALLAFAALKNNDKLGLALFTDRIERLVHVAKGRRHVLRIVRDLVTAQPLSAGTNVSGVLDEFQRRCKRPSIVFVVSDFLAEGYGTALRNLARRHDVVPVVVRDRREVELPTGGLLQVTDPETGRLYELDGLSARQRAEYRELALAEESRRTRLFRKLGLDAIELWTDEDPLPALRRFLDKRESRR